MVDSLHQLPTLPRPVYGQADSLPNIALGYRHSHPWLQFSYASHGVLDVLTDHGRYFAPPQQAVWIPPGVEHQVRYRGQARMRSLYVEPQALTNIPQQCAVVRVSPLLRELINAFSQLNTLYPEQGREALLVRFLLDQLEQAEVINSCLPLPQNKHALRIAQYLQEHPDCNKPLSLWAVDLGVSEKTLGRYFSQQTGLGFRLWRQRLRVLSSLTLLEQQQPVTEVALACGYDSISAFIRAFSGHFHCTPKAFFSA